MAKNCIECGVKKGWLAKSYAGLNLRTAVSHPFPDRIEETVLPGLPSRDFLCCDCANKIGVLCKVHGPINENLHRGRVPVCPKCRHLSQVTEALHQPAKDIYEIQTYSNFYLLGTEGPPQTLPSSDDVFIRILYALICMLCAEQYIEAGIQTMDGYPVEGGSPSPSWSALAGRAMGHARAAQENSEPGSPDVRQLAAAIEERCEKVKTVSEEDARKQQLSRQVWLKVNPTFGGATIYVPEGWTKVEYTALSFCGLTVADCLVLLRSLPGTEAFMATYADFLPPTSANA